jgi:hypothetical protein
MANEFPATPISIAGGQTGTWIVGGGPVNAGDVVTLSIHAGIGRVRLIWVEKERTATSVRNRVRVHNPGAGVMAFRIRYGAWF